MLAHWGYFQFRLGKGEEAYNILSSSAAFLAARITFTIVVSQSWAKAWLRW